jgi:hypothetical protein
MLFPSSGDLQDYAEHDPAGGDLMPLVDLAGQHGVGAILLTLLRGFFLVIRRIGRPRGTGCGCHP